MKPRNILNLFLLVLILGGSKTTSWAATTPAVTVTVNFTVAPTANLSNDELPASIPSAILVTDGTWQQYYSLTYTSGRNYTATFTLNRAVLLLWIKTLPITFQGFDAKSNIITFAPTSRQVFGPFQVTSNPLTLPPRGGVITLTPGAPKK